MSKDKKYVASSAPKKLEMTAYQGGQAVVREKRDVTLPAGKSQVAFEGLPNQLVEGSLTIVSVEGKGQLTLGPISYRAANLSPQAILEKSVGKTVQFHQKMDNGYQVMNGKLLHVFGNQVVVEGTGGVFITTVTDRTFIAGGMPAGLTDKASLMLEPTAKEEGEFSFNILYETDGISWQSKYEAFYDDKAGKLNRFACWVQLSNNSGAPVEDAVVKLIAQANHNRNVSKSAMGGGVRAQSFGGLESVSMAAAAPPAGVESVGEAKMYTLPESISLADGETKQMALAIGEEVPVKQEYFLNHGYYGQGSKHENAAKEPVYVRLRLTNDKGSNLGMALPPGEVTVFQKDSSGAMQKVDSSSVQHVADGEQFTLSLRNPTKDIKATRASTMWKEDPEEKDEDGSQSPATLVKTDAPKKEKKKRFREEGRELVVHNYKDTEVEVSVREHIPANAEFIKHCEHFTDEAKKGGTFKVKIPAKGKTTVSYQIRYHFA
jgi:hypothetical protein